MIVNLKNATPVGHCAHADGILYNFPSSASTFKNLCVSNNGKKLEYTNDDDVTNSEWKIRRKFDEISKVTCLQGTCSLLYSLMENMQTLWLLNYLLYAPNRTEI